MLRVQDFLAVPATSLLAHSVTQLKRQSSLPRGRIPPNLSCCCGSILGLQNGTVLQFDMRQTARHVESLTGLTGKLVHTLHSLSSHSSWSSGIRSVLTAFALGLCQLNFGRSEERQHDLVPESDKQGVSGQAAMGSHVLYRKTGATYRKLGATCGNVSDIRVPIRCAIMDGVYQNQAFASGDELTSELIFQELPSQMVFKRLKPKNCPIYDVKYSRVSSSGLLGCLSEDSFQLYTSKLLSS